MFHYAKDTLSSADGGNINWFSAKWCCVVLCCVKLVIW